MSVEFGFTQAQLMTEFSQSFLEDMIDYQHNKVLIQKHNG